jgi:hypothetical protein
MPTRSTKKTTSRSGRPDQQGLKPREPNAAPAAPDDGRGRKRRRT